MKINFKLAREQLKNKVIRCDNKEEYDKLQNILLKLKITWPFGAEYLDLGVEDNLPLCISISNSLILSWSHIHTFLDKEVKILSMTDFKGMITNA